MPKKHTMMHKISTLLIVDLKIRKFKMNTKMGAEHYIRYVTDNGINLNE